MMKKLRVKEFSSLPNFSEERGKEGVSAPGVCEGNHYAVTPLYLSRVNRDTADKPCRCLASGL